MKTSLYRFFDATDQLLYVGISCCLPQRLAQHEKTQRLVSVQVIELEWFESRKDAEEAEALAIIRERPLWNKIGARKQREVRKTKPFQPKKPPAPAPVVPPINENLLIGPVNVSGHVIRIYPADRPEDAVSSDRLIKIARAGDTLLFSDKVHVPDKIVEASVTGRFYIKRASLPSVIDGNSTVLMMER